MVGGCRRRAHGRFERVAVLPPDVEHVARLDHLGEAVALRRRGDHAGHVGAGGLRALRVVGIADRRKQGRRRDLHLGIRLHELRDRDGDVQVADIGLGDQAVQFARAEAGVPAADVGGLGRLRVLELGRHDRGIADRIQRLAAAAEHGKCEREGKTRGGPAAPCERAKLRQRVSKARYHGTAVSLCAQ